MCGEMRGGRKATMFSLDEHVSFDIFKTYFGILYFYINWVWHVMLYPIYLYMSSEAD